MQQAAEQAIELRQPLRKGRGTERVNRVDGVRNLSIIGSAQDLEDQVRVTIETVDGEFFRGDTFRDVRLKNFEAKVNGKLGNDYSISTFSKEPVSCKVIEEEGKDFLICAPEEEFS